MHSCVDLRLTGNSYCVHKKGIYINFKGEETLGSERCEINRLKITGNGKLPDDQVKFTV